LQGVSSARESRLAATFCGRSSVGPQVVALRLKEQPGRNGRPRCFVTDGAVDRGGRRTVVARPTQERGQPGSGCSERRECDSVVASRSRPYQTRG
jgi:hypothetical protein